MSRDWRYKVMVEYGNCGNDEHREYYIGEVSGGELDHITYVQLGGEHSLFGKPRKVERVSLKLENRE